MNDREGRRRVNRKIWPVTATAAAAMNERKEEFRRGHMNFRKIWPIKLADFAGYYQSANSETLVKANIFDEGKPLSASEVSRRAVESQGEWLLKICRRVPVETDDVFEMIVRRDRSKGQIIYPRQAAVIINYGCQLATLVLVDGAKMPDDISVIPRIGVELVVASVHSESDHARYQSQISTYAIVQSENALSDHVVEGAATYPEGVRIYIHTTVSDVGVDADWRISNGNINVYCIESQEKDAFVVRRRTKRADLIHSLRSNDVYSTEVPGEEMKAQDKTTRQSSKAFSIVPSEESQNMQEYSMEDAGEEKNKRDSTTHPSSQEYSIPPTEDCQQPKDDLMEGEEKKPQGIATHQSSQKYLITPTEESRETKDTCIGEVERGAKGKDRTPAHKKIIGKESMNVSAESPKEVQSPLNPAKARKHLPISRQRENVHAQPGVHPSLYPNTMHYDSFIQDFLVQPRMMAAAYDRSVKRQEPGNGKCPISIAPRVPLFNYSFIQTMPAGFAYSRPQTNAASDVAFQKVGIPPQNAGRALGDGSAQHNPAGSSTAATGKRGTRSVPMASTMKKKRIRAEEVEKRATSNNDSPQKDGSKHKNA